MSTAALETVREMTDAVGQRWRAVPVQQRGVRLDMAHGDPIRPQWIPALSVEITAAAVTGVRALTGGLGPVDDLVRWIEAEALRHG